MKDEDIDYSDLPERTDEQLARAKLMPPRPVRHRGVILEPELERWLEATGRDRNEVLNEALREYRERHPIAS